ncbi:hypothetical protein NFI96_008325, partial [Prochilodus magdalenae]
MLCVAGEEGIRLQELEGNTVTIHTGRTGVQSDAQILWMYRSEDVDIKIVNSQIIRGEIITDYYSDRFRDRLQLDRTSGSLTIRNTSREDSGVYKLHVITGGLSIWSCSINVYAPVSKPIIRNQAGRRSVSHRESCSPLCSVENGKDVNLSCSSIKTSHKKSGWEVLSLLCVAGEEGIRLQELEGNTVTIHTGGTGVQSDAQILWFYISEDVDIKIVDNEIIKGEITTDYDKDRFRDRLQLDRTSGSLTIRNTSRKDSGVYKLHIITGHRSVWSFSVDVYAPVSKPIIINQAGKRSVRS